MAIEGPLRELGRELLQHLDVSAAIGALAQVVNCVLFIWSKRGGG